MTVNEMLEKIEHAQSFYFERRNKALEEKDYDEEDRNYWIAHGIGIAKKIVDLYAMEF